jgi:hypothetical protein
MAKTPVLGGYDGPVKIPEFKVYAHGRALHQTAAGAQRIMIRETYNSTLLLETNRNFAVPDRSRTILVIR